MARPKKYASEAERKAAEAERKRLLRMSGKPRPENSDVRETDEAETHVEAKPPDETNSGFVPFRHQPHVPLALFDGHGRGTVRTHTDGREYVMVSRHTGPDVGELGVISAADWSARLGQLCEHGHRGWACHEC